jgi:hypothetical protein
MADTPADYARGLRNGENAYLTGIGHRMTWTRGHGQRWLKGKPGYTGRCELCDGVCRLAWLRPGVASTSFEGAMAKKGQTGPRRCTRGR